MDSFTYVISSINASVANSANNCYIELSGLPANRKFKCEVIDFVLDVETINLTTIVGSYLSLVASSEMQILDGVMHPRKFDRMCNINLQVGGVMTGTSGNIFTVGNFNKHTVNFQLLLPNMTRVLTTDINQTSTTYWTLSLKMTPIIE
jgi:hypothetical protein